MKTTPTLILLVLLMPLTVTQISAVNQRDYWPTEGWRLSTPESQGMSNTKLQEMTDYLNTHQTFIDGVVVIRHGYLVYEAYPNPEYRVDSPHLLYSVTKSFTSSLIGIASDKNLLKTSDKMLSFFPDKVIENLDDRKQRISVENLLMMCSGLKWDESSAAFTSPANDIYHINNENGLVYCLNLPMVSEPGTSWLYNTGASHILSGIVTNASGMTTLEFAKVNLFDPLGIKNVIWGRDRGGTYKGGFDLQLTPRDMAKFGWLYLNNGLWDNKQIVSESWVSKSTSTITNVYSDTGYGYQWWTTPSTKSYSARGLYGQYIFVYPEKDLVVAMTAGITSGNLEFTLLSDYILTSITSTPAPSYEIPANPTYSIVFGLVIVTLFIQKRIFRPKFIPDRSSNS